MATSVSDLLSLFFSGDAVHPRAGASLFVQANYPSGDFSARTYSSPESVKNSMMEQLMNPENYVSKTLAALFRLIRDAAWSHKAIDSLPPTGMRVPAASPTGAPPAAPLSSLGGAMLRGGDLPREQKKSIFLQIYAKLSDIDPIVRAFFQAYLKVQKLGVTASILELEALEIKDIDSWVNDYNIELIPGAAARTLFGDHLPSFPLEITEAVYWKLGVGETKSAVTPDSLREYYIVQYDAGASSVGSSDHEFDLNWPVFLRNVQAALEKKDGEDCKEEDAPSSDPCCDDLPDFTDMAYGEVWKYDIPSKTYYKMVNGKKVEYATMVSDADHCYSVGDNNKHCLNLLQCLLDGNPKLINSCMNYLKDKSIWRIAKKDIGEAHPDQIKLILRKFHVRAHQAQDENGKNYKYPMSFEEWSQDADGKQALPADARAAIDSNSTLMAYIKCLINFCRENPVIINKFVPKVSKMGYRGEAAGAKSDYATRLNKQKFYDISSESGPGPYAVMREQLMGMGFRDFMPKMLPTHMARLQNVVYMNPNAMSGATVGGGLALAQRGGSPPFGQYTFPAHTSGSMTLRDGSSDMFTTVFRLISQGLGNMKVQINEDDRKKIECAINKIKELENKLLQIVKRYSIAIRMGESMCATNFVSADSQHATIKFENITDEASARAFMGDHARALHDAYQSLHGHYSNLCSSLATQVFPRYLDRCCEKDKAAPAKVAKQYVDFSEPCN